MILRLAKELVRHFLVRTGLFWVWLIIRKWKGGETKHLKASSLSDRFSLIYELDVWKFHSGQLSQSGAGSEIRATEKIREALPGIIRRLGVNTLVDVGCGDFNWMRFLDLGCDYIGVDIVEEIIKKDKENYTDDTHKFIVLDATTNDIPNCDAILCREVMFHLSFRDNERFLFRVTNSGAEYFIATTDDDIIFNSDIPSGDFRLLNLLRAPFNFPEPDMSMPDDDVTSHRRLAIWKVTDILGDTPLRR